MVNTKKLEKEIARKEEELLQEFKEELLAMNKEEFEEYFNLLVEKYYKVLFTFDRNYSRYRDNSKKAYDLIKDVKKMLGSKYNNLNNYEAFVRYDKAEDIAYNQMNQIHFMEERYSGTIYYNAIQELRYISNTLSSLVELYKTNPSEELLAVIESMFNEDLAIIVRDINRLPVYDNLEDYKELISYRKEHLKNLSEEEKEELPEVIFEGYDYTIPVLSVKLPDILEMFNSVVNELEAILPEDVLTDFHLKVNANEQIEFLNFLLETKSEEESEEDVYRMVASLRYNNRKEKKTYLYEYLDIWS